MEKKKTIRRFDSLRTLFSHRNFISNFLRRNFGSKLSASGFTLIELLIVIALIGVLATGIIVTMNPLAQIQKANDAKRKSDLNQIQKAVETYYNDFGHYPPSDSSYQIDSQDDGEGAITWGAAWKYMSTLPKDPSESKSYAYFSTGQAYYIYANLDKESNSIANPGEVTCGTGIACNYGVSSPNVSP